MYIYIIAPIIATSIYYLYNKYNVGVVLKLLNDKKIIINYNNNSAMIEYEYFGQNYKLSIPYNRKKLINMSDYKAELFFNDDKPSLNITQQPGIPYILSANDLGGEYIKITNMETGLSHNYDNKNIPMYADELINNE
jgi:hypothetical protein